MKTRLRAALLAIGLCISLPAFAGEPSVADRETARAQLEAGDKAFAGGDFAAALKAFQTAHALLNLPATGMGVVKSQIALGQLLEARETALSIARIPKPPVEKPANVTARADAEKAASDLAARIPSLVVEISAGPDAKPALEINGATIPEAAMSAPRKVNPGKNKIKITAAGYNTVEQEVVVSEKEVKKIPVKLDPAGTSVAPPVEPPKDPVTPPPPVEPPPPPKKADSSPGVSLLVPIGFSVAGAGVVTGLVTGVLSMMSVADTKDKYGCAETCPAAQQAAIEADLDGARTTAWVSDIGFAVAGAGAIVGVVGVVLTVTAGPPSDEAGKNAAWTFRVRPAGAGLTLEVSL